MTLRWNPQERGMHVQMSRARKAGRFHGGAAPSGRNEFKPRRGLAGILLANGSYDFPNPAASCEYGRADEETRWVSVGRRHSRRRARVGAGVFPRSLHPAQAKARAYPCLLRAVLRHADSDQLRPTSHGHRQPPHRRTGLAINGERIESVNPALPCYA